MASRRQCVIDILGETDGDPNKGWQTDPAVPTMVLESQTNTLHSYIYNCPDNGVIVVKKEYDWDPEKLSPTKENRIWTFNVVLINQSETLLDAMFDQFVEVFDRYTSAPFATDTNSITYSYARVVKGVQDPRLPKFVMDCQIILCEFLSDVVIA